MKNLSSQAIEIINNLLRKGHSPFWHKVSDGRWCIPERSWYFPRAFRRDTLFLICFFLKSAYKILTEETKIHHGVTLYRI